MRTEDGYEEEMDPEGDQTPWGSSSGSGDPRGGEDPSEEASGSREKGRESWEDGKAGDQIGEDEQEKVAFHPVTRRFLDKVQRLFREHGVKHYVVGFYDPDADSDICLFGGSWAWRIGFCRSQMRRFEHDFIHGSKDEKNHEEEE